MDILARVNALPEAMVAIIGEYSAEVADVRLSLRLARYKRYIDKYSKRALNYAKRETKGFIIKKMYASFLRPQKVHFREPDYVAVPCPARTNGDDFRLFHYYVNNQKSKKTLVDCLTDLLEDGDFSIVGGQPFYEPELPRMSAFVDEFKRIDSWGGNLRDQARLILCRFLLVTRIRKSMFIDKAQEGIRQKGWNISQAMWNELKPYDNLPEKEYHAKRMKIMMEAQNIANMMKKAEEAMAVKQYITEIKYT